MNHTFQTVDDWVKGRIVLPSHLKNTENIAVVIIIIILIVSTEVVQFREIDRLLVVVQTLTTARVAGL